jgi:arginyl-tRNA synthetase
MFSRIDVAGPGYINFTISMEYLVSAIGSLLAKGSGFLRVDVGKGAKAQIEFVSANPTGPLHLGHGRGAAVGAALANLLEATGYDVTREYYINDAGRQVELLGESVFARYNELLGVQYTFPPEGYRGDYIRNIASSSSKEFDDKYINVSVENALNVFIKYSLDYELKEIRKDLEDFGVRFDVWQSERELYSSGAVRHATDFLSARGLMYESGGALWFRATEFGDEKDRVVIKSDGQHTYFASDIAYHLKKVESGYDEIIDIWGADHHGYIPRMEAVMDALGKGRDRLRVLLVQMVSLLRAGSPVQMSKRAGEFVTLREVVEEVGADTTKFIFLTRRHDSHLNFDLEDAKASSAENPVYYIQYANARINSIFAHASEKGLDTSGLAGADLARLVEPEETRIMKKILLYPMTLESAALNREPHRITFYLQELAAMFHPYYNRHRVVTEDRALSGARLALCGAVRIVLKEGLGILGITAPEKM